jgi:predicted DNA-binding WGR domain protein
MRRFEFVEGTSAKFWEAIVEGSTFTVVYGRLGTAGQRKEKPFATEAEALKEYEKKVAEKLREGYHEVSAGAVSAPAGVTGAAAASPKLTLAPRSKPAQKDPALLMEATKAVLALDASAGGRSWHIGRAVARARKALAATGAIDPKSHPALNGAWESVVRLAAAPKGARRLPASSVISLLYLLDIAAFDCALKEWKSVPDTAPAAVLLKAIVAEAAALDDSELALRLAALLSVRSDRGSTASARAAKERFGKTLRAHLDAVVTSKGAKLRPHLEAIESKGDRVLAANLHAFARA